MGNLKKLAAALIFASIALCGCSSEKSSQNSSSGMYRTEFTDQEKKNGHAKFDLMENVKVDADITPKSKYRRGLKKYYMDAYWETKNIKDIKDFEKNPCFFGKSISEVMDILSDEVGDWIKDGKFKTEFLDGDGELRLIKDIVSDKGKEYKFELSWYRGGDYYKYDENQLRSPYIDLTSYDEQMGVDFQVPERISDYGDFDVPFIDKEKKGREIKKFVEKITGVKLNDYWECVPVTEESTKKLNKISGNSIFDAPDEERCTYFFYDDIDGFPYHKISLRYEVKPGESYGKIMDKYILYDKNLLDGLHEPEKYVAVSKNGIEQFFFGCIRKPGEVYKKAEKIIDPNEVMRQVKEDYEQQFVTSPVIINDVRIVYAAYFTDYADGEIQPSINPFWMVTSYVNNTRVRFVFDAFTGERIL